MKKYQTPKTPTILLHNSNTLEQKIISNKKIFLLLFGILIFGYYIGFFCGSLTKHPNIIEKLVYTDKVLIQKYNEPFSENSLKLLLKKLKVNHLDIVLKQAKIESGNFSSKIFIENNNLFGMKLPGNRITTATGENLNHATYDTWQESVIDYAIWQSTFLKNKSRQEYLNYLHNNYAENKKYVSLINKMK